MAVQMSESDRARWASLIPSFSSSASQFSSEYAQLRSLAPYIRQRHPEMSASYDALIARGAQLEAQIANTRRGLADIQDALLAPARVVGSTASGVWGSIFGPPSGTKGEKTLGAAPIVVAVSVATVGGLIFAIGNWVRESQRMKAILNETRRLEETGLSPDRAAAIARGSANAASAGGVFGSLFGVDMKWVLLGAAALFFLPSILREWKK